MQNISGNSNDLYSKFSTSYLHRTRRRYIFILRYIFQIIYNRISLKIRMFSLNPY